MGDALSYRWGTGRSPSPVDGHSLLPGRGIALGVLIITQMGDRHEVAALVDGHSIIVQMGDDYRTDGGRGEAPPPSMATAYSQGEGSPWESSLLPKWGTGTKWLLSSMAIALSYKWGMIIVQMGDGAKPLPRRWPQPTPRARDRPGSPHYYPNGGQARSGCSRRWP